MFKSLKAKFKEIEYGKYRDFGNDISTPETRRKARWHFRLFDHSFLRVWWTNLAEIAPGVWRSNQPSPERIALYANMGIKTILSLRGDSQIAYNLLEKDACAQHGITLVNVNHVTARGAVSAERYLALLEVLEGLEKPFLVHCKSGADRAGFVSALYLMHFEGLPVSEAKKQLSIRHMHLKSTKTGILDHILETYEADQKTHGEMPIKEWFETRYDKQQVKGSFKKFKRFP